MNDFTSTPNFDELAALITERFETLRPLNKQWAELGRKAIQGLPYDTYRLAELEVRINTLRPELRKLLFVASEHFTGEQISQLQKQSGISKYGWRVLKDKRPVNLKYGFRLVIN